eukprot:m.494198 g.494198  ORF g.494198 m.494198 type:complete len:368 (+) comp57288_c0_seq17:77-1180(+)
MDCSYRQAMAWTVIALALVAAVSAYRDPIPQCPTFPARLPPSNVNELKPQDIRVVMAMGDSITAGFSMLSRAEDFDLEAILEYRGAQALIGGDPTNITLPNFLRHYTPNNVMYGASINVSLPIDADIFHGGQLIPNDPKICHLNAAQSGAIAANLISEAEYLIRELPRQALGLENEWKVLSILIGANDLCNCCHDPVPSDHTPEAFARYLNQSISMIQGNISRVFVNLLPMFNISQVYWNDPLPHCRLFWDVVTECECMSSSNATRTAMDDMTILYNQQIESLASYWNGLKLDDFAIVVQPMTYDLVIPNNTFVSRLDCFHPSLLADEAMAIALWNNMITPAAQKQHGIWPNMTALCAQEDTLLYTY